MAHTFKKNGVMHRKNKVKITSCGSVVDTQVKINGQVVKNCQLVRYKWTEKEQALTVVYLETSKGNRYYKVGEAVERQYIFRNTKADFEFSIKNFYKQIHLTVKNGKVKVMCGGKKILGISSLVWQMEACSDIPEFEITIL